MAALMDMEKMKSPEVESRGGLFAPDCENSDILPLTSKLALVSPSNEEYDLLMEDIRTRISETQGETIYELGVGEGDQPGLREEDFKASEATLQSIAETLDLECVLLRDRPAQDGKVAEYLLRRRLNSEDFMEIRVAVVGNVDAGKSTLLGVLTHGELDNGRGVARQKLFRHKHEVESGRTSSVGNDILGFDAAGGVVNKPDHGHLDWIKICEEAAKVITFIDLAGHERYLKTTVFGMTGHAPDFAMLMIGANAGVIGMTKEHLGLALALNVPVFVVITKIDMCPANVLQETLRLLNKILKSPGCRKIPVLVQTTDDVVVTATNFTSARMCPVFQVSNVTGDNLDLLKMFLNLLSTRHKCDSSEPAEFQIDDTFSVPGVGTVVSGTLLAGHIKLNDTLLLGPDNLGQFQPLPVKSIHRKRMPVREVRAGQTASFALKKIKRASIRKGMVLVSPRLEPQACWEFEGEILVLHHPTTISVKYQAMVHVGSVRQTATILTMTEEHLRTGDKALVRFRFIKNPEYLRAGLRLVFREGRTKAVGNITRLFPHVSAVAQNTRQQRSAAKKGGHQHHHGQEAGTSTASTAGRHSSNPQNEPQKASKRNRRAKKGWGELDSRNWESEKENAGVAGAASGESPAKCPLQQTGSGESPRLPASSSGSAQGASLLSTSPSNSAPSSSTPSTALAAS